MGIVGSAKIRFLISNIFEKYYVQIQEEREFIPHELDNKLDIEENTDFDNVEKIGLENERKEPPIIRKMEEPRIRRFQTNWTLTILISILLTLMLWFVVGILMGRGYLPRVDFGYTWFNSHIWSVF